MWNPADSPQFAPTNVRRSPLADGIEKIKSIDIYSSSPTFVDPGKFQAVDPVKQEYLSSVNSELEAIDKNPEYNWLQKQILKRKVKRKIPTVQEYVKPYEDKQRWINAFKDYPHKKQVLDNLQLLLFTPKRSVTSTSNETTPESSVNSTVKLPVKLKTINWNQVARNNGFKDVEEVKEYQKMLGVTVDGKWGKESEAAIQQYLALADKGWKQGTAEDGSIYFIDPTTNERVWATGRREAGQPLQNEPKNTKVFNVNTFYSKHPKADIKQASGQQFYRYDPDGVGDWYVDQYGNIYEATWGGGIGNRVQRTHKYSSGLEAENFQDLVKLIKASYIKQGGKVNRIKYFQQGGTTQPSIEEQVISLVQAAMQGDQQATQQVEQILAKAQQGDPQAAQLAQLIQQALESLKGQATRAKWGAKLGYIQHLKSGKKTCPECGQPVEKKACGGKKAKKKYFGGWL